MSDYPEHDRTSCSDESLSNVGFNESGNAYCRRCSYLYIERLRSKNERLKSLLLDYLSDLKVARMSLMASAHSKLVTASEYNIRLREFEMKAQRIELELQDE